MGRREKELSFPPGSLYLRLSLGLCSFVTEVRLRKENGVRERLLLRPLYERAALISHLTRLLGVGRGLPRVTLTVSLDQ